MIPATVATTVQLSTTQRTKCRPLLQVYVQAIDELVASKHCRSKFTKSNNRLSQFRKKNVSE